MNFNSQLIKSVSIWKTQNKTPILKKKKQHNNSEKFREQIFYKIWNTLF